MTRSRYAIRRGQKEGRWGFLSSLLSVVGTAGYDERRRRDMYVERGRLREANDDVQCIRPRRLTRGRRRRSQNSKEEERRERAKGNTHTQTHALPGMPLPRCPPCAVVALGPPSSSRTRVSFHSLSPRYPAHQKNTYPGFAYKKQQNRILDNIQYPTSRTFDQLSPCQLSFTYCTPPDIN
jgi:hypothetical protein